MQEIETKIYQSAEARTKILEALGIIETVWNKTSKRTDQDGYTIPNFNNKGVLLLKENLRIIINNEKNIKIFLEIIKRKLISNESLKDEDVKNFVEDYISFCLLFSFLLDEMEGNNSNYYFSSVLTLIKRNAEYCYPHLKTFFSTNRADISTQIQAKFATIARKINAQETESSLDSYIRRLIELISDLKLALPFLKQMQNELKPTNS